ncbi:HAD domain-containing protein [Nonlabens antarcticus]|uniref:HAD domain-containing protein n=1 Tax=Nonlabens antarcticus TaxID=392714 RepID=UPI0018912CB8|nr:HAD domain-containing protein [Nonlabens antarcticus]
MLIYLDIDGVMVPANSWRKLEILEDSFPDFSRLATKSLHKILSSTNATIVLTTSHKHHYTLEEWKRIFEVRGIPMVAIHRLPENTTNSNRKEELLNWFDSYDLTSNFIIIDDDKSLNALPEFYKKRLIQTSASVGLTEHLADEAIELITRLKSDVTPE